MQITPRLPFDIGNVKLESFTELIVVSRNSYFPVITVRLRKPVLPPVYLRDRAQPENTG